MLEPLKCCQQGTVFLNASLPYSKMATLNIKVISLGVTFTAVEMGYIAV